MLIFDKEYSDLINTILIDIYSGTEYWGVNKNKKEGIIRPITKNDHPTWSNYNFINTHWTTRNKVVDVFLKRLGFRGVVNKKESKDVNTINNTYFNMLWDNRYEIFGPESLFKDEIIEKINATRSYGDKREVNVEEILNKLDFIKIELKSGHGSSDDLSGLDALLTYQNKNYTTQIKPFLSYVKVEGGFLIRTTLKRKYTQDILIFSKQQGDEYHIVSFWNQGNPIDDREVFFKKEDLFLAVNYNFKTNKISYKLF
jgi:hypothetical protein